MFALSADSPFALLFLVQGSKFGITPVNFEP